MDSSGPSAQTVRAHADPVVGRWLAGLAVALIVGLQLGTIAKPLGSVGPTRVADWLDLATPYAILGCAAVILHRVHAERRAWVLFGIGAITFTLGHGIHLAANSVSNVADDTVADAPVVHLWDEVVSHWIWYTGLALVLGALAWSLRDVTTPRNPGALLLAGLVALTLVNTYIEGGTPFLGIVVLGAALALGLLWRPQPVSALLLVVGGLGLALLLGWGLFWLLTDSLWFPEFSELGWI